MKYQYIAGSIFLSCLLLITGNTFAQVIQSTQKITIPFAPATTQIFTPGQIFNYKSAVEIEIQPETDVQQGSELVFEVGDLGSLPASLKRNWTLSRQFNENGTIIKQEKKYYDNTGKLLQWLGNNLTAQKVMVGQIIYDGLGRPALKTLPAPKNSNDLNYAEAFVTNAQDQPYSYADFDAASNKRNPAALGNSAAGTLGWYFSNNNSLEPRQAVTGYPYIRTDYYNDGTNDEKHIAGVGEVFRMGQGHETSAYKTRVANELDLYWQIRNKFFSEAVIGSVPATLKNNVLANTVIDMNGLKSVTVTDDASHILMKAIAGSDLTVSESVVVNEGIYTRFAFASAEQQINTIRFTGSGTIKVYETTTDGDVSNLIYQGTAAGYPATRNSNIGLYITSDQLFQMSYNIVVFGGNFPVCVGCPATFKPTDSNNRYFKLLAPTNVTITGTGWQLSDMGNDELPVTFTSGNTLAAGYYKLTAGSGSAGTTTVSYQEGLGSIVYNFYNQAGLLMASINPEGVKKLVNGGLANYATIADVPFTTLYTYNLERELISKQSPDEGKTEYVYRKDGKLRFSQNAKQRATSGSPYSYVNYDKTARIVEYGEYLPTGTDVAFNVAGMSNVDDVSTSGGLGSGTKNYWSKTVFDVRNDIFLTDYVQDVYFLGGRPSYTESSTGSKTWFNYDENGKIIWQVQNLPGIGKKTIDYEYSPMGLLTKMIYQKTTAAETFVHYYQYDADSKLAAVYTNTTDNTATKQLQAKYNYYLNGSLKRTELGGDVQGLDYTYTAQGWLKAINNGNKTMDPGQDGISGTNAGFGKDAFGMNLEYYSGDYTRNNSNIVSVPVNSSIAPDLFNGDVKAMNWYSRKPASVLSIEGPAIEDPRMYGFLYDQKSQLKSATWGVPNYTTPGFTETLLYAEKNLNYDTHGNIQSLTRTNGAGTVTDNFSYSYTTNSNKLQSILNGGSAYASYTYNQKGEVTSETTSGTARYLKYEATGLVIGVYSDAALTLPMVTFLYNERGHRIQKKDLVSNITTYYVRDFNGLTLSSYEQAGTGSIIQTEVPLYASTRIGVFQKNATSYNYELTDHLGNVRVVLDKTKQILAYTDYYPFGYELRSGGSAYKYGYQGQSSEKDRETGWNAFELRMYNSRIGRWLSTDPKNQYASPYLGMGNNHINVIDKDGAEGERLKAQWYKIWHGGTVMKLKNGYSVVNGPNAKVFYYKSNWFNSKFVFQVDAKLTAGLQYVDRMRIGKIKIDRTVDLVSLRLLRAQFGLGDLNDKNNKFKTTLIGDVDKGTVWEHKVGMEAKIPGVDDEIGSEYSLSYRTAAGYYGPIMIPGSLSRSFEFSTPISSIDVNGEDGPGSFNIEATNPEDPDDPDEKPFFGLDLSVSKGVLLGVTVDLKIGMEFNKK